MVLVKVFINGYGNIGRRLATALSADKEIQFVGVAKYTIDDKVKEALDNRYSVFVPENMVAAFKEKGYNVTGPVKDAVAAADLVVDAAKEGGGFENKKSMYEPMKKTAIFQGGEDRHGEMAVADMIHNSRVNYAKAQGRKYVIQGSCNVSGMGRIMQPLVEKYGPRIKRWDVSLIRRWADLEDTKAVKDSIEWDRHPHHQDDVKDFIPDANLYVDAFKVPSRMMHLHQMMIRFDGKAPSKDELLECYRNEFGVAILSSAKGTGDVRKKAMELGFAHGDTNMVHIHGDILRVQDDTVKLGYSDDQTGMVIPENHMLIQSMAFRRPREEALKRTDSLFQMSKKRKILEEEFK
ncbi:glyceraldehyde 3-phosphate dehydrogenase (NAD(P)+) [Candidatus Nitrososphaera evergladensis SR1]|jgi:glyceraldehyde-3-phosphate dehydrogenase (NAD(P))|uniref:Glyceraldehyde 3-phosphate dehydrogenase (NAD(P)+) n=1 Tax=Candidatus Nitrososphaera evergladensis SR1 TaxID=1459636 RepID=A0A075MXD2_9ARCH|nr:type II glyceraldehyde-3-phosphate dehydrogenase [Candidatus Nitrososphaera evergladensis]AIF83964.1 glyceraldehyde 3-phosphate dehydrogenase (NAD(P)+) [Candidatus Nitrososphaera evergladensis SR1]